MTTFTDAKIVDVKTGDLLEDGALVVQDGVLAWAGVRSELPGEFDTADATSLGGGYVVPGLISCHVHFNLGFGIPGGESIPAMTLRSAENARRTLRSGRSVRMTGTEHGVDFALRESIQRGETTGPRIYTVNGGISAAPAAARGAASSRPTARRSSARPRAASSGRAPTSSSSCRRAGSRGSTTRRARPT